MPVSDRSYAPRHAAPHRQRRAALAAALSALLPGSGQLLAGRRRLGLGLMGVTLFGLGSAAWWLSQQTATSLSGILLNSATLLWLLAVNVVLMVARMLISVHAYRAVMGHQRHAAWGPLTVAVVVVAGLVVAPHSAAAYVTVRSQAVIDAVFVAAPPEVAQPPNAAPSTGEDLDVAAERPDGDNEDPDPQDDGQSSSLTEAPELAAPTNPWIAEGRMTVAVIGSDLGPGRASARTDVMMVMSIDTVTGQTALFSIDRYMRGFPVPAAMQDVYDDICARGGAWDYLNAVYTCATGRGAEAFAALYPNAEDPGAQALTDILALLLDLPIAHYAKVDMEGFVRVVDAVGGVRIDLADSITVRMSPAHEGTDWRVFRMPRGPQVMDGETALAYARMRDPGDGPRMRRQRCLVASLAEHTSVVDLVRGFGALSRAVETHVVTNIPVSALPDLIEVAGRVDHRELVGVGFGPPTYRGEGHAPAVDLIRARVREVIADPQAAVADRRTVEDADDVCR